jgi:hypothetical protein
LLCKEPFAASGFGFDVIWQQEKGNHCSKEATCAIDDEEPSPSWYTSGPIKAGEYTSCDQA